MTAYTALIIAYKRDDLIRDVLAALALQTVQPSRIVIVDNGGELGDAALGGDRPECPIDVVPRSDNPGYAAAVNEARPFIVADGATRLLVLTHDADFEPELAETLLGVLDRDDTIGAAGPVLHRASNRDRLFSAGGRLSRGGRASHVVDAPAAGTTPAVDWLDGAIVLYSVDALDEIEWLDERYFLYFEDVDTSWRLRRAGYASVVSGDTLAYQDPGAHPTYLGIRNMTLFAERSGIGSVSNALAVARRVAEESAVAILDRRRPPLRDAWRGWRDGRRGLSGKPPVS
ncbi:glycosyltransferase family 2 protein [Agromyces atrinae]|uniref:glycosyltransferase n=1 Tax=Agromyces atrinae TaxID=592376 RepID=UPI001F583B91|nr:glycosyltransferase family 2 protein [Agromyces atrinae]MCI2958017.1 glycosyltransferase family 2 protein [Agromyces atrinae]